ncbi:MAG: response regulator [Chloroflexi bacterium]|nr:response regulator [Chloroflexota bacterium]
MLVVDDSPEMRRFIQAVVEEVVGARVALATDGEEGLRRVQELRPDLVLLNLMLPKLDGFEVARRLKADATTRAIPVIAVTGLSLPQDRQQAMAAGCDDFLPKPFTVKQLEDKVREHLPG